MTVGTATLPLTETDWMDFVAGLAQMTGWRVAHFRAARTNHGWRTAGSYDAKGFPDLVMCHPERELMLFVEVKNDHERLAPHQAEWRNCLIGSGAEYRLWRPKDREEVVALLTDGKGSM